MTTADDARTLGALAAVIERHCPQMPDRIILRAAGEPHVLVYWLGEATKSGVSARDEIEPIAASLTAIPTELLPVLQADYWAGFYAAKGAPTATRQYPIQRNIRMTPDDAARLTAIADQRGLDQSTLVRTLLREEAERLGI